MINDYRIADADGHWNEPADLWEKGLAPELLALAPQFTGDGIAFDFQGQHYPKFPADYPADVRERVREHMDAQAKEYYKAIGVDRGAPWTPDIQVKGMDMLGIDVGYIYPTRGLQAWAIDDLDPRVAAAMATVYNDWGYGFAQYEPKRLKPVAGISLHDPAAAVAELKRVAKRGTKGIFLRPNPLNGRLLSDPAYETFWTECERLNVAVGVHEGGYTLLRAAGADRFGRRFSLHATSHPMEHMMAFLALLEGGVLERHPTLRFAFLESGCGWVPYWLFRLDYEYGNLATEVGDTVKMKPSDYFRRQCWVSFEPEEPYIPAVIDAIGEDRLLFASDYPHPDHPPDILDEVMELEDVLSKKVLKKILWDNPLAFYGE